MRPKCIRLEHQVHSPLSGFHKVVLLGIDDILSVKIDISSLRVFKTCDYTESRRFSASRWP